MQEPAEVERRHRIEHDKHKIIARQPIRISTGISIG
jgi:hypothetical protein